MADADPHVRAVKALLDAGVAGTAIAVHEGKAPNQAATPYLVLYGDPGFEDENDLTNASVLLSMTVLVRAVGSTAREALGAADVAKAALLDTTPTVDGRSCWPIRSGTSQPVRQESEDPDLFAAVKTFSLQSIPS